MKHPFFNTVWQTASGVLAHHCKNNKNTNNRHENKSNPSKAVEHHITMICFFNNRFLASVGLLSLVVLVNTSQAFIGISQIDGHNVKSKTPTVGLSPLSRVVYDTSISVEFLTKMQAKKDISNSERGSENVNNLMGLDRAKYIWPIVIAINIWFFSIPVEYRRTRFCNEADSAAYPERCMTSKQFTEGISNYYKNGEN
uniref:Uncharacterized protein n=1 Tax=Pseudo-nitzschia australis TaxID=44445 RepID=A0A7S4A9X0_9STRA